MILITIYNTLLLLYYFNNEIIGSEIESIFKIDKNKIELKWKVCNGIDKTYSKNIHSIQSISPGLLFKFIANCIGSKEPDRKAFDRGQ